MTTSMLRELGDFMLAVWDVFAMLSLAFIVLLCLPFYSAWTWFTGDPWWKETASRPANGFWNTKAGKGGFYDHP